MKQFIFGAVFSFLFDRVTKFLAVELLRSPLILIPGVLDLRIAENRGAAFSIFSGSSEPVRKLFLIVLPVLVVLGIFLYSFKNRPSPPVQLSLGLIAGGALGNLYDRIIYGKVVDFIDFHVGSWHYPTFNIADVAVSLGVLILLLFYGKDSVERD